MQRSSANEQGENGDTQDVTEEYKAFLARTAKQITELRRMYFNCSPLCSTDGIDF